MKYELDFNKIYVYSVVVVSFLHKNRESNVVATKLMKFPLEARLSPLLPLAVQSDMYATI